jgi:hypothetical protein
MKNYRFLKHPENGRLIFPLLPPQGFKFDESYVIFIAHKMHGLVNSMLRAEHVHRLATPLEAAVVIDIDISPRDYFVV